MGDGGRIAMTTQRFVLGHALAVLGCAMQLGCAPKASLDMDIDPETITLGQSATITWHWKTSNGGYCKPRGAWAGTGARDARGSEIVTPTEVGTLTYTLKCEEFNFGPEEKSASVTLTVNAATASAISAATATEQALPEPQFAYVTNGFGASVTVVDTATHQVAATIDFPAGSVPFAVALSPHLESVYVTTLDAFSTCGDHNGVFVIDTASNTISAGPIAVGCEPTGIAITPDGQRAYVASALSDTLSVIDTATAAVSATIPLSRGGGAGNIAITPDGLRAYATTLGLSPVFVIDLSSNTEAGLPIDVGTNPSGIAISPDGRLAYVANQNDLGSVTVIDTATNTVITTTPLDHYPTAIAFTPEGTLAYVTQGGINNGEFTVSMIDTASHAVVGSPITVGSFPTSIAITADGTQAYVGNEGSNTVSVIDTASNTVTTTLEGMNSPRGVAARPLPPIILRDVPDVVGETQEAAEIAIGAAELVVGTVTRQSSSTVANGSVISQDPAAGDQIEKGSAVNLVVSSGEAPRNGGGGGGAVDLLGLLLLAGFAMRGRQFFRL